MAETDSDIRPDFLVLDALADFQTYALQAVQDARRKVYIFSDVLDEHVYDNDDFLEALRNVAINDRYSQIRILLKDIKPLVERGHRLLELARRLSSKVEIRKLVFAPRNSDHAFLIADTAALLYKHNDDSYSGYVDFNAAPKCKLLIEEFNNMWEMYAEVDPSLRYQLI